MVIRPSITEVRSLGDMASMIRWGLAFSKLPTAVTELDSSQINLRANSMDLPKSTSQKSTSNIRGHKVHQAGELDYSDSINFTLLEAVDTKVMKFLQEWREMTWRTISGIQALKSDYEATVLMYLLNNQDEVRDTYKLTGCWLLDFDPGGQMVSEGSELMRPTMTLAYDFYDKP